MPKAKKVLKGGFSGSFVKSSQGNYNKSTAPSHVYNNPAPKGGFHQTFVPRNGKKFR